MRKKELIIISFFLLMCSCTPVLKIGIPYHAKAYQLDEIIFNKDSSFLSEYMLGYRAYHHAGQWIRDSINNRLILKDKDIIEMPMNVEEKTLSNEKRKIDIMITGVEFLTTKLDSIFDSLYYITLVINNKHRYKLGYAKAIFLPDTLMRSNIKYHKMGFINSFNVPDSINVKEIQILIDSRNNYHRVVNNDIPTRVYKLKDTSSNYININLPINDSLYLFYYKKLKEEDKTVKILHNKMKWRGKKYRISRSDL
ncbi:hypothetical protein E0494_08490 [Marinilabiliaceae bacterium JC040]|nr:hypothetical protein [Marinilabiliaceae bacterium JC040]